MSNSGSVASPSAKAGFRSKAKEKAKGLFRSSGKSSVVGIPAREEENGNNATSPRQKGSPAQSTSNADFEPVADVPPAPSPFTAAEIHSNIAPSTNNSSAIAESVSPPTLDLTHPNSTEVAVLPLVSSPPGTGEILCPIHELWNQAYDELKMEEEKLMADYESLIGKDISTIAGLTVSLSGLKVQRQEQLANLLRSKVEEVKQSAWKLKFGGKDIPVKDLTQPAVAVINWANDYISTALASNPYASIAWSGVSLLLPLVFNPSNQAASLTKGLSYISDLIVRSKMREDLYERRYECKAVDDVETLLLPSHTKYRDALKQLYFQILKFQATVMCYFSRNQAFRLGLDVIKWNGWDSAIGDIQERESAFDQVYDIWRDVRCQEESEALLTRHEQNIKNMAVLGHNVLGLKKAIMDRQSEKERTELLGWLSQVDPSENFNTAIAKHKEDTGNWLLENNKKFKAWQMTTNSLLWLNGKAGSGKSVLCASAVKHIQKTFSLNAEAAIVQFYFSFSDVKKQNLISMLSSIIKQLCCYRPDTPASVESFLQYKLKGERPDIKVLEEALLATMHGFTYVYVFLDALDECPYDCGERNELLSSLCRIRKSAPDSLRLFLTSRRERDIEAKLQTFSSIVGVPPIIDLDLSSVQEDVERDIGLYIDQTFRETDPFYTWNSSIQAEAKATLIQKADGMFQYVACQFDSLRDHHGAARIRKALDDLPIGLDETYERILQAVKPGYRKQVANTLKWLAFSMRPLSLEELAEIFILDVDSPVPFDDDDRLDPVDAVLGYLPGLVVKFSVLKRSHTIITQGNILTYIKFAHFSIREYLSSERAMKNQPYFSTRNHNSSHLHIADACLAFHLQLSASSSDTLETMKKYCLWDYAVCLGMKHLEKVPYESWTPATANRVTRIFLTESQALLNFMKVSKHYYKLQPKMINSALHYAAEMGLFNLASHLSENGGNVNEISPYSAYGTPLAAAAYRGHKAIVKLLLQNKADVNKVASRFRSALHAAVYGGKLDIVQLLLDHNADVNIKGGWYGSALQEAARFGRLEIVQLLLDHNANVNQGGWYGSALQAAAAKGKLDTVQLLLQHGANINAKGGRFGNALQAAVVQDNSTSLKIASLLLSMGAEVDPPGEKWEELLAMITTSSRSSAKNVEILRKFQADPNGYIERRRKGLEMDLLR